MSEKNRRKVVIVGGVAGGASAAARLRRQDEFAEITVVERGPDVSFANCGLPYYIGGEIVDRSRLAVQTPESLSQLLGLAVLTRTEAVGIDRTSQEVEIRNLDTGETSILRYDQLVLAPGAAPLRPPLPGIEHPSIHVLRTLGDMDRIRSSIDGSRRALVIGAGFIGLEMAEQLKHRGLKVTLVELQDQVLPQMDPEMTRLIEDALRDNGVELMLGDGIRGFAERGSGVIATLNSGKEIEADLVLLSIGVRPESSLAKEAGLELGPRGHVVVDRYMRTSDPSIYAVGDVIEYRDSVLGQPAAVPLGGLANRQGRVAADHMVNGDRTVPYPGSLGTAIVRVFDSVAAVTGWTGKRLTDSGVPFRSTIVTDFSHASYYPGAIPLSIKLLWRPDDGRILGAQVVGVEGVDKRIDVLATAITGELTIDHLVHLELAYAPPFGSSKDPVNIAGFSAGNIRDDLFTPLYEIPESGDHQLVDVRPKPLFDLCPVEGAINIPMGALRSRIGELDRRRPVVTVCALGKTSYFAARVLRQHGFEVAGVVGGIRVCRDYKTPTKPVGPATPAASEPTRSGDAVELDATGVSCPGPLLELEKALKQAPDRDVFQIRATDPDFPRDLGRFCENYDLHLVDLTRERGIISARVARPTVDANSFATI